MTGLPTTAAEPSRAPRAIAAFNGILRSRRPCTPQTRRCDFWNWGEDYVRPPCCTGHLMTVAVSVRDILTRHGIVHWLDYGALLGAVRDGRLIPWDSDVDFGIMAADRDRVMALRGEFEARGHEVEPIGSDVLQVRRSRANAQHADLYLWRQEDGLLRADPHPFDWPGTQATKDFPAAFIEDLEEVTLEGETFPAPSSSNAFLAGHRYGPSYLRPVRPPSRRMHLLPEFQPDEVTPAVAALLGRIGAAERTLGALSFPMRGINLPLWERWVDAGLPRHPRRDRVARMREVLAPADRHAGSEALLELLDRLEHGIEERRSAGWRGGAVRTGRRLARLVRR